MPTKTNLFRKNKLDEKDDLILTQLEEGKSIKEIADNLKCSVQNVYSRIHRSSLYVKDAVGLKHAVIMAKKQIDFGNQLLKAAQAADKLLNRLNVAFETREKDLQKAVDIKDIIQINKRGMFDEDLSVKVMAEIRQQVAIWHNIRKDLFSMQQVSEAFNEIIEVIGELAPDARAKIVKRLRQKGLSEGLVQ